MPTLKQVALSGAAVPGNFEKNLPAFMPKLSPLLAGFAAGLPVNPALPALPFGPGAAPMGNGFQSIIKGVQDALPKIPGMTPPAATQTAALSRLGASSPNKVVSASGYRSISTQAPPPSSAIYLGGGYRSI